MTRWGITDKIGLRWTNPELNSECDPCGLFARGRNRRREQGPEREKEVRRMLTYTQVLFLLVVPPALGLAFLTRPFMNKMETAKLAALVTIAFLYSTPW